MRSEFTRLAGHNGCLIEPSIRIGIVDTNDVYREGLRALFDREPGFICIGSWGNFETALGSLSGLRPDILIFETPIDFGARADLARGLEKMDRRIARLALIDCTNEKCLQDRSSSNGEPGDAGQNGHLSGINVNSRAGTQSCRYLLKDFGADAIVTRGVSFAILSRIIQGCTQDCADNGKYLVPEALRNCIEVGRNEQFCDSTILSLTPREREIAALISAGLSNKRISADLRLSYSTVKNHVSNILGKLDLDHRTQIAIRLLLVRTEHRGT